MSAVENDHAERIAKLKARSATRQQSESSSAIAASGTQDVALTVATDSTQKKLKPAWKSVKIALAVVTSALLVLAATTATVDYYRRALEEPVADPTGMVWIPTGKYLVGSMTPAPGDIKARWIQLSGFAIDKRPVSTLEFMFFAQTHQDLAEAEGWTAPASSPVSQADRARNVPLAMAWEYCATRNGRLPTEAEWDIAARGRDGRTYPWGNTRWKKSTKDVSPFGIRAMVTGGMEWLGDALVAAPGGKVVVRGRVGPQSRIRTINYRAEVTPTDPDVEANAGFRCAATHIASRAPLSPAFGSN